MQIEPFKSFRMSHVDIMKFACIFSFPAPAHRLYGKETHEEAVDLLKSSPSLVLAVQSGTNSLGPGAEF